MGVTEKNYMNGKMFSFRPSGLIKKVGIRSVLTPPRNCRCVTTGLQGRAYLPLSTARASSSSKKTMEGATALALRKTWGKERHVS